MRVGASQVTSTPFQMGEFNMSIGSRFFGIAVTVICLAVFCSNAAAALRVTMISGAQTRVFYAVDTNSGSTSAISIGDYNATIQISSTNYDGTQAIGSITQSLNINSIDAGPGVAPDLVSIVEVIDQVGSLDAIFVVDTTHLFEVTGAALTAANLSPLLVWAEPVAPLFDITADSGASNNMTVTSGTNTSTAFFNYIPPVPAAGGGTVSATVTINSAIENMAHAQVPGTSGYTLANRLVVSGMNRSAQIVSVDSTVAVAPLPEPSSLAIGSFLALSALVGVRFRRR